MYETGIPSYRAPCGAGLSQSGQNFWASPVGLLSGEFTGVIVKLGLAVGTAKVVPRAVVGAGGRLVGGHQIHARQIGVVLANKALGVAFGGRVDWSLGRTTVHHNKEKYYGKSQHVSSLNRQRKRHRQFELH